MKLISHRLYLFPQMDQIIWMEDGKTMVGTHEELLVKVPEYKKLFTEEGGAAVTALIPPLILAKIVDTVTAGKAVTFWAILLYFAMLDTYKIFIKYFSQRILNVIILITFLHV